MSAAPLPRRLLAEFLGSAFLAATVVGSGIAAAQLSPGDTGLQLLENAAATAAGLFTFILMFGPVSGAHFNPVVSLVDAAFGGLRWRHAFAYIPAQVAGCIAGAIAANVMFDLSAISIATTHRASPPAPVRRGDRHPRPAAGDLLPGAERARQPGAGRGRRLHRLGLLLHQLDQLRQPGDRRRPHVLRHLRRHRPGLGPGLRRSCSSSAGYVAIAVIRSSIPTSLLTRRRRSCCLKMSRVEVSSREMLVCETASRRLQSKERFHEAPEVPTVNSSSLALSCAELKILSRESSLGQPQLASRRAGAMFSRLGSLPARNSRRGGRSDR